MNRNAMFVKRLVTSSVMSKVVQHPLSRPEICQSLTQHVPELYLPDILITQATHIFYILKEHIYTYCILQQYTFNLYKDIYCIYWK